MSGLAARLSGLNPFQDADPADDDDLEFGEIDNDTVAGGGHGAWKLDRAKGQLRVSHALKSFLVHARVLSEDEAGLGDPQGKHPGALQALVESPHINVPEWVTDRSHPLPAYLVSSSHNTYLNAHQLFGTSSAGAYESVLRAGSRCIEIDAWDNDDDAEEPKVTHGYTLVSHISFRAVCEAIRNVVDQEAAETADSWGYKPAPVLVSLENHCEAHGQQRLVAIMKEIWGDRLLAEALRGTNQEERRDSGEHVRLDELGSKIVVIVEYHLPSEANSGNSSTSSSDEEDDEESDARKAYREKKKATKGTGIIPELAALGVYAQSVKPRDNSWFDPGELTDGPHHHLINVSETGLQAHMPANSARIVKHNASHLMRVFPKGTRISSKNLQPVPFWGVGAQVCALNWQTFNSSMQLNEALFAGTDGYVLKPPALRPDANAGSTVGRRKRIFRLHVAGATDVFVPPKREDDKPIRPYLTCSLVRPGAKQEKRKTAAYKHHRLGFLHRGENPPVTDPVWNECLEWEYEDDGSELEFARLLIKSDDSFARNPVLTVAAVRLLYAARGWRFVRMLDAKGRETACSLLVKFEIEDVAL